MNGVLLAAFLNQFSDLIALWDERSKSFLDGPQAIQNVVLERLLYAQFTHLQRKQLEQSLLQIPYYDSLTGDMHSSLASAHVGASRWPQFFRAATK